MEEQVFKTICQYGLIENKDKIVVGVSGGPDSCALLNFLIEHQKKWELSLFVCHINHEIRKEAEEEEQKVKSFCEEKKVPCYSKHIQVQKLAKEQKLSTETVGRNERYAFFKEIAEKVGANRIATAHNAKDNAETILLNLLRGTGVSGLKGIEPIREGKYIRPLIDCQREQIEAYCKEKNLSVCIDKTNFENIYTRNKVRNQLIPMLEKEFNPNLIETLGRLRKIGARRRRLFCQRNATNLSENWYKKKERRKFL